MSQQRTRDDQYMLRMPDGMRDRIKSHAKANGQSLNTAILIALDQVYPAPVEPEHVNKRLLQAAMLLAGQWSAALEGMGVDPDQHPALRKFHQEAQEAMESVK